LRDGDWTLDDAPDFKVIASVKSPPPSVSSPPGNESVTQCGQRSDPYKI
jgi:hypothetical protein